MRLKTEGKDGKFMFKKLVQMMWFDVEERIKNLGVRRAYRDLISNFFAFVAGCEIKGSDDLTKEMT